MKHTQIKKLAAAGVLIALGVACSPLSIPVGASRCFPVQHMVNIIAAVLLGPWYGFGMAFCTSLLRLALGTGTLLAFPGSMAGALLAGLVYARFPRLTAACLSEVFGTSVIGGLLAWPLAVFVLGKEAALFAYVLPFFVSTAGGAVIAGLLLGVLRRTGALETMAQAVRR